MTPTDYGVLFAVLVGHGLLLWHAANVANNPVDNWRL